MPSCARCGASPARLNPATRRGITAYYCYDEHAALDCYTASLWADFPELDVTV